MKDVYRIAGLIIKRRLKLLSDTEKSELDGYEQKFSFARRLDIKILAEKINTSPELDSKKAWAIVKEKYQDRNEKPLIVNSRRSWIGYAVAASVACLIATAFFLKNSSQPEELLNSGPKIAKNAVQTVKGGTDKAMLTLGDGKQVALLKGSSVQIANATSNGEEIVYESSKKTGSQLVYNYLTIPRGGQFLLRLSDGTKVWLNSASQLKFPEAFIEGSARKVELVYGEAYFEVSPSSLHNGSHFQVHNRGQKVDVIGTEFNIKAYQEESNIYTTLVNGKVDVEIENKIQKLVPNQQLLFNLKNGTSLVKTVDVNSEISWKDGIFDFRGKPLKEIMIVISRWYDVDIVFVNKSMENIYFKGSLKKKQSLEDILSIMTSTTINGYEIKGKTVIIR